MDGWMDRQTEGWDVWNSGTSNDEHREGWVDGQMDKVMGGGMGLWRWMLPDKRMDCQMEGWMKNVEMHGGQDGWKLDGEMERGVRCVGMDGQMDEWSSVWNEMCGEGQKDRRAGGSDGGRVDRGMGGERMEGGVELWGDEQKQGGREVLQRGGGRRRWEEAAQPELS